MNEMDAYERRCRQLLRAYPRHYREQRGSELLGTLLDAAAPGRRGPTVQDSWDLVRGGLATRLRHRPGLWRWIGYRFGGVAAGVEGQEAQRLWARDDLLSPWFRPRFAAVHTAVRVPALYLPQMLTGAPGWFYAAATAGLASIWLIVLATTGNVRRRLLAMHGFHPDGTPLSPDEDAPGGGDVRAPDHRRIAGGLLVVDRAGVRRHG